MEEGLQKLSKEEIERLEKRKAFVKWLDYMESIKTDTDDTTVKLPNDFIKLPEVDIPEEMPAFSGSIDKNKFKGILPENPVTAEDVPNFTISIDSSKFEGIAPADTPELSDINGFSYKVRTDFLNEAARSADIKIGDVGTDYVPEIDKSRFENITISADIQTDSAKINYTPEIDKSRFEDITISADIQTDSAKINYTPEIDKSRFEDITISADIQTDSAKINYTPEIDKSRFEDITISADIQTDNIKINYIPEIDKSKFGNINIPTVGANAPNMDNIAAAMPESQELPDVKISSPNVPDMKFKPLNVSVPSVKIPEVPKTANGIKLDTGAAAAPPDINIALPLKDYSFRPDIKNISVNIPDASNIPRKPLSFDYKTDESRFSGISSLQKPDTDFSDILEVLETERKNKT